MRMVVSPYHLTTRELPAMAALLLARSVVTMMPVPAHGVDNDQLKHAASEIPRYHELIDAWRWCAPLWDTGLISSIYNGDDPALDVKDVVTDIHEKIEFHGLAGLIDKAVYLNERSYLAAVSLDLLRGGPDPGVCVPIACGLDRFASRHHMVMVRSTPVSLVQRTEARVARKIASVVLPVFAQVDADTILQARVMLEPELEALRGLMEHVIEGEVMDHDIQHQLRSSVARFTEAFDEVAAELATERAAEDTRVVVGTASLSLVSFPNDTALIAGAAAAKSMGLTRAQRGKAADVRPEQVTGRFSSMIVKPIARAHA